MKVKIRSLKYVFCISLFLSASIVVKSQMVFDTLDLDEMEIFSSKYEITFASKTQTIDTLAKRDLNHLSLAELLSANSPVFIKSYGKGSIATAAFRGTAASHTKVLWNGFQINSPMLGQTDLSLIPNSFFDLIRLEYGGSSLHSTSGALGGAISLETSGEKSGRIIDFTQSIGSFNTYTSSLKLNLGNKKIRSLSSVYLNSSDNSFSYYNNALIPAEWQKQENATYFNRGFTQGFKFNISDYQSIEIFSWNQWNHRELPSIMTNQQNPGNKEEQHSFSSRNTLKYIYTHSKTFVEVKTAWFYEDMNYELLSTTAIDVYDTVSYINSNNKTNNSYFNALIRQELKKGWIISGEINYNRSTVKSNNYLDIKSRDTYGLFIDINKEFGSIAKMNIILRQDLVDGNFLNPMPFIGFSIKPFSAQDLFVSISSNLNYNLPSLNDLYWQPGGNPELKAEQAIQIDAGLKYSNSFNRAVKFSASVDFYKSNISNWIQWVPTDYRYWTAQNIAFVKARGMEASMEVYGNIDDWGYKFSTQYSLNKSTNESEDAIDEGYSGRQLIYVPLNSGNVFAFVSYRSIQLIWNSQFIGERHTSLNQESHYSNTLPAYSLSNISISKSFKIRDINLNFKFKINNTFDKSYQAILWRPMPGRNFEFFINIKL